MQQVKASIISTKEAMPDVYLIWLECPSIASSAQPGQFIMVKCGDDNLLRRPLSIHQVNDDKNGFALLFSVIGKGTDWLSQSKTGDKLDVLGPLGNGFSILPAARNILLVGGGIGIAPLPFLARTALNKGCNVTLLLGAATACQLCPQRLIPTGIECTFATDDGTAHAKGFVTNLLPEHTEKADQVFACGPAPMYRAMSQMPELGGKPVQVSLEARMGCGFGLCYGCTVKTRQGLKQICKDGPVFNLDDILWDEFADV